MPKSTTTWPRESARLAFFAVAMGERKDEALLGLIEQANNAVETYLNVQKSAPPALFPQGSPPIGPLPSPPASSRPLSITASPTAPPLNRVRLDAQAPLNVRPSVEDWQPSPEVCRQFCVAFAAIEAHLPKQDYQRHLAMYDTCSGRGLAEAARDRQVDVAGLRRAMQRMKQVGPKAYLDAAVGVGPQGTAL